MSDQQSSTNTMRRPVMTPQQKRAQILLAACYLVAIVLGLVNGLWGSQFWQTAGQFISDIFIRLFRFIAIPIIAVSIISTLATISRSKESGKIFRHTIFYTLLTTVLAASLAAVLFVLYAPANVALTGTASQPEALANIQGQSYFSYIESVIPDNIIAPFLSANVLSVLIIAAAVGIAIAKLPADSKEQNLMITFFTALQSVLFTIVNWIIKILPIGIFGFFTVLAMQMATGVALGGLGVYLATVLTSNFVQMLVVLPLILLIRGINPLRVAKGMLPALTVAGMSAYTV